MVFLGNCVSSLRPIWNWQERAAIHSVAQSEKKFFPVLARSADGKYLAAQLEDLPIGAVLVYSVTREEEKKINRDLCDSIGWAGDYRYFRVLTEEEGTIQVSLEVPTTHDSKIKGWYVLKQGSIIPQRIVKYGPGFAFIVMPWTVLASLTGVAIYLVLVRRKKPNQTR